MSAEDALEQRQATLVECQDMLAEMQSFSEAQRARADQEQAQAQVGWPCNAETVTSWSSKRHSVVTSRTQKCSARTRRQRCRASHRPSAHERTRNRRKHK